MTHFTVMVQIPKDRAKAIDKYVEEVMSPYDENIHVEPYVDWSMSIARKKLADEIIGLQIKVDSNDNDKYNLEYCKAELERLRNTTVAEYFDSRIKYYEDKDKDVNGNGLSTYNPNSKHDSYRLGGRWDGWLVSKETGEASDLCRVGDIDWEAMEEKIRAECTQTWCKMVHDGNIKLNKQGRIVKPTEKAMFMDEIKAGWNLEDYINDHIGFSTFAVLTKQGVWLEPAKMGWWAITRDEKEDGKSWEKNFGKRFVLPLDQDDWIALLDCHI